MYVAFLILFPPQNKSPRSSADRCELFSNLRLLRKESVEPDDNDLGHWNGISASNAKIKCYAPGRRQEFDRRRPFILDAWTVPNPSVACVIRYRNWNAPFLGVGSQPPQDHREAIATTEPAKETTEQTCANAGDTINIY